MKLTQTSLLLGLLICTAACLSAFFSVMQATDVGITFYATAALLLIFLGRELTGNYSNFAVVFLTFSALYSLSGPLSARYGEGIPGIFPTPYLVDDFILHYSLAVIGLAVGLMLVSSLKYSKFSENKKELNWNKTILILLAYVFALTASLMEITNLLRIGGLETLYAGKAAYQSAVSELVGTLPSTEILLLATGLLGLSLSGPNALKRRKYHLILWLLCSTPLIINLVVLGRRGPILATLLVFIIGYFYFNPVKKISLNWVGLFLLTYLMMVFLFGMRGILGSVLATGDLNLLIMRISDPIFWEKFLNPASNEFGAVFGNFNTYILSGGSDLRLGETYLIGLTIIIPRFIWPNKPQSITYEFRDTYFADEALRGSIAGTAYSGMLEAYVNFDTIGVLIVFFLIALVIGYLELKRTRSRSLMFAIFYLTLIPEAMSFHRSSLEMPIFWPLILAFAGAWSYIIINSLFRKRFLIR